MLNVCFKNNRLRKDVIMEKVWYYKYCGLPLCGSEKGAPIHAKELSKLPTPEQIVKRIPAVKIADLSLEAMRSKEFYAKDWPV